MKNIAITGSTGVLGKKFISKYPRNNFLIFNGDIADLTQVNEFIDKAKKCDTLINFAALVPREVVEFNPFQAFKVNAFGIANILQAIQTSGNLEMHIILPSTSHVYKSSTSYLNENSETAPRSVYGITKLMGEQISEIYKNKFDLKILIPRISSYTDSNQSNNFFIPAMLEKIYHAGHSTQVYIPQLNCMRDFITSNQVVSAINSLIEIRHCGIVNIGTGIPISLRIVVQKIIELMDRHDLEIISDEESNLDLKMDTKLLNSLGISLPDEIMQLLEEMVNLYVISQE